MATNLTAAAPLDVKPVVTQIYLWTGVALGALGVVQLLAEQPSSASWLAVSASVVGGVAVAALPRAPVPAMLGICGAVSAMVVAIGVPVFATFVAAMLAAFTVGRYATRRQGVAGFAILVVTVAVVAIPEIIASEDGLFGLVYPVFYFGGAALLGWMARQRAVLVAAVVESARIVERDRDHQVELAAAAERERLAREMHDVVSHGVSLMVVQAEAAREVLHRDPRSAETALDAIADAGRTAMTDLHRMLGVLRGSNTDLVELAASVRSTGLPVDLSIDGEWSAISDPIRATLFRVAQESLTNTIRHASRATHVSIQVACSGDDVSMEVLDDGLGPSGSRAGMGSGLNGLQERVRALGGRFESGPRGDRGFRVLASFGGDGR